MKSSLLGPIYKKELTVSYVCGNKVTTKHFADEIVSKQFYLNPLYIKKYSEKQQPVSELSYCFFICPSLCDMFLTFVVLYIIIILLYIGRSKYSFEAKKITRIARMDFELHYVLLTRIR